MLKNIFRGFIVLCGSIVLPFTAYAGFFSNPYNHYYIDVGTAAYYLQLPKFEVGTAAATSGSNVPNTTAPLAKTNINNLAPQLNLSGGYQFMNCNDNWLSKIFGHEEALELAVNYLYLNNSASNAHLGSGNIWYIDGSGSIFGTGNSYPLTNYKLNTKINNVGSGLYFKGKIYTTNPRLTMLRYIGFVYDYSDTKYDYSVRYDQGIGTDVDTESFDVTTNYFGVALGSQLNYQLSKHFVPFGALEVDLLNINSNLKAHQKPGQNVLPQYIKDVNASDSAFNYRAIAALGINYLFNDSIKSPTIGFRVGVDHWNYVPRVVPPNHAGDEPVHIVGDTTNSSFAMLDVHVPFG